MSHFPVKIANADPCCGHDHTPHPREQHTQQHPHEHRCCGTGPALAPSERSAFPVTVPSGSTVTRWYIAQMDCPTEEALIRKQLAHLPEVQALEFNLMQRTLTTMHRDGTMPAIEAAIRDLGMSAQAVTGATVAVDDSPQAAAPWRMLAIGGFAALLAEIAPWVGGAPAWMSAALSLAAVAISGLGTYRKGWIALRHGDLNINTLMSIAVIGASDVEGKLGYNVFKNLTSHHYPGKLYLSNSSSFLIVILIF